MIHDTPIDVKCYLDYTPVLPHAVEISYQMFSYVHGLKTSSSYGCQNIAHGHLSYIAVNRTGAKVDHILSKITSDLDGIVFMNKHDMKGSLADESVLQYTSETRGVFTMITTQQVVEINTDSTVENMVDYVVEQYGDQLKQAGVTRLWVSEGLVKGSVVDL